MSLSVVISLEGLECDMCEVFPDTTAGELIKEKYPHLKPKQCYLSYAGEALQHFDNLLAAGIFDGEELEVKLTARGRGQQTLKNEGKQPTTNEFFNEVKKGGPLIQTFIDAGVPVDVVLDKKTALFVACLNEDIKSMEILIANGANVNMYCEEHDDAYDAW